MDNKLSELSKPVGYYRFSEDGVSYYLSSPTEKLDEEVVPLYSQEYVSALTQRIAELEAEITNIVDSHAETVAELRAKLEAKDKRIAELENESLVHRHRAYAAENKVTELQAKLATPVQLPKPCAFNLCDLVDRDAVIASLREQGFTVSEE
ncbi:TPA: hypothetical protein SMF36_000348 [Serratia marcescens]|nr:hypothetical protein [Serratia marcescens]HEJ6977287.1 hypothetical protein [Serratia marcescens]